MKTLRWCLLLLLSLALPLQAAAAAGLGACLRHAGNRPAQTATAPAAGHHAAAPMGRMAAAAEPAQPEQTAQTAATERAAPAPPAAAAHTAAPAAATNGSDCAQHHPAPASAPSVDHSCSSCSWCSLGTALPSHWQGWITTQVQQAHPLAPVPAYGAPSLRAPERPPRA